MSYNKKLLQQITEKLNKPSKPKVPRNQWQHPGEVTSIASKNITMRGVTYPVLGVDANGYAQMMQPDEDYVFTQGPVMEYPMMADGGTSFPTLPIIPLQQIANFTNWIGNKFSGSKSTKPNTEPTRPTVVPKDPIETYVDLHNIYNERFKQKRAKNDQLNWDQNDLINLSTGRFRGAKVPKGLIDDAIKAATLEEGNPWDVVSLIGRESGFGSGEYNNRRRNFSKELLVSGWNVAEDYTPYDAARFLADKKVPGIKVSKTPHRWNYDIEDRNVVNEYLKQHPELFEQYKKKLESTPDIGDMDSFRLAARRIKQKGIQKYNPNDRNYVRMLNEDIQLLKSDPAMQQYMKLKGYKQGGEMIRRADGSYSQRGLWDNIRANRGSGKKPTKEMLEQERKIKSSSDERKAEYGMEVPRMDVGGGPKPKKPVKKTSTSETNPYKEVMSGNADFFRNILPVPDNVAQLLSKQIFGDSRMSNESLEDRQKILLWDVIQNAKKRTGKNNSGTEYEDYGQIGYGSSDDFANWFNRGKLGAGDLIMNSLTNPGFKLASTIGRGRYWTDEKDPDTVYYTDVYDWNPSEKNFKGTNQYQNLRNYVRSTEDKNLNADKNEKHRMNFKLNKKEIEKLRTTQQLMDEGNLGMGIFESGGQPQNKGFQALPEYVQAKILANMGYGGMTYPFMQQGGEPDGAMALGQINAAMDKLANLRKFIQPDSDLEPWVSSKLTMLDHYTDAVSDYMQYNPEAQGGMMMDDSEGLPMEQMKEGGIPQRYKNMGFNKVGAKKKSTRPGKKWMVLAKKGDDYKVVHGGYKGMQDYTQHGSEQRRKNFWNRMGGKNSSKATDPFSPLYWHKRFGTWANGGEIDMYGDGGYYGYDGEYHTSTTPTWSGNVGYAYGGDILYAQEGVTVPKQSDYPDYESYSQAIDAYIQKLGELGAGVDAERAATEKMWQEAEQYTKPIKMPQIREEKTKTSNYKGNSIIDLLNSRGEASDLNSRKALAKTLGINNYTGKDYENLRMIELLTGNGNVPKSVPKSAAKPKSATTTRTTTSSSNTPALPGSPNTPVESDEVIYTQGSNLPEIVITGRKKKPVSKGWLGQTADEFIQNDPYFIAEESDPDWIKLIDSPLAHLRNQGARMVYDLDPLALAELIATSFGGAAGAKLLGRAAPYVEKVANKVGANAQLAKQLLNPNVSKSMRAASAPQTIQAAAKTYTLPANTGVYRPITFMDRMNSQLNRVRLQNTSTADKLNSARRALRDKKFGGYHYQEGGPMVGDEMDVTPEQLEMLRQMGYEFEMI